MPLSTEQTTVLASLYQDQHFKYPKLPVQQMLAPVISIVRFLL